MLAELHPLALSIAAQLRNRNQRIAAADGATGGMIAAALLSVPGALDFFVGGGVVYSYRAREVLFGLPSDAYRAMRGASEEYALLQARGIRGNFHADWGIAESGAAGGSRHPGGASPGTSWTAIVGPQGEWTSLIETGLDHRIANMEAFTRASLAFLEEVLRR